MMKVCVYNRKYGESVELSTYTLMTANEAHDNVAEM